MENKEIINSIKPLVNQFIMKNVPEGFQDKSKIGSWLTKRENQDTLNEFLDEKNIEYQKVFICLLAGKGQYLICGNEINLLEENFFDFDNIFDISQRLNDIQIELNGNPSSIAHDVIWVSGIKDEQAQHISLMGIGAYLGFETEMPIVDYYDSLFKSLIPVPELSDDFDEKELENYFNSRPEITDPIEEKVRIDMKIKVHEIMGSVLNEEVENITQNNFVSYSFDEDNEEGSIDCGLSVILSNEKMAKSLSIDNFFDDLKILTEQYPANNEIKKSQERIIFESKKRIKEEFEKRYKHFQDNPKLEPLNKHKKPLTVKFL